MAMHNDIEVSIDAGTLVIIVPRGVDIDKMHAAWAPSVLKQHPGPFAGVRIDLSRCGLLTSSFISQIYQLQQAYAAGGPVTLVEPDPRFVRVLEAVGIRNLFTIIPRS
jgi:anti-anti-sigma regulatory factor